MQPQQGVFEIRDVRVLEILNNPLRLRILYQLMEPRSAAEVALALEVPVTRLYYHLNLLLEVGVIEVVETRKKGAMTLRLYRTVATRFEPVPALIENTVDKDRLLRAAVGAVLDGARIDAMAGLTGIFAGGSPSDDPRGTLGRSVVPMTEKAAREFVARLDALVDEMTGMEAEDGEEYAFSFVFFPMVGPVKGGGI
jgi:DNA-binding transcriptional ArsR family regulator